MTSDTARGDRAETPETWFHRRATLYVEAQILFHLNQVGVLALLGEGGRRSASEVAEELRLELQPTDALLDYIYQVDDLLERDDEGRYSLSPFGKDVVGRFSDAKALGEQGSINMFDVRVGAYGPVWQNLGKLLTGEYRYGVDLHRAGEFAEDGVFKLAMRFWDSLAETVDAVGVDSVLEVGLTTGLLEKVGERYPAHRLYGLDRSQTVLDRSARSAAAQGLDVQWLHGDFFDVPAWTEGVAPDGRGLIFSLHCHELMADGPDRFVEALRGIRKALPNWSLVAFEQPQLPREDREKISETLWLYSQSNILIHHLIGNGRILSRDAWLQLGREAGCRSVSDSPCNYLGYRAFVYEF